MVSNPQPEKKKKKTPPYFFTSKNGAVNGKGGGEESLKWKRMKGQTEVVDTWIFRHMSHGSLPTFNFYLDEYRATGFGVSFDNGFGFGYMSFT